MIQRNALLGTLAVAAHVIVVVLHSRAHDDLGIQLNAFQQAFAGVVIVIAPLLAAGLLWGRYRRVGSHLLWLSMAGALAFGVYYHFVAISPDHVAHLPPGQARGLFRLTAVLLPVSEALGLLVGIWGARSMPGAGSQPGC